MLIRQIPLNIDFSLVTGQCIYDIETSGLNPKFDKVFIFGIIYKEECTYILKQVILEDNKDYFNYLLEIKVILSKFKIFTNFNGTAFDLNFLNTQFDLNNIPYNLKKFTSHDVYKILRDYSLLKLDNYKQSSIEKHIGIERKDDVSGEKFVYEYKRYMKTKDEKTLNSLVLHNEMDLINLGIIYNNYKTYINDFLPKIISVDGLDYIIGENTYKGDMFIVQLYPITNSDFINTIEDDFIVSVSNDKISFHFKAQIRFKGPNVLYTIENKPIKLNKKLNLEYLKELICKIKRDI
jgi:hypothetical protein